MVPISSDIYSSAAVVMDNRSLFDYIQKIEDRRAKRALAEQEAVDKYIEDASKKLTPTGMRAQDVPNFLKMQNDFRQLSNQYKSTKDPYKRLELQKKGDEMFLFIQRSKQADELAKPTREALKNPENRKKLNTEKMMQDLAIHDLPLDFQVLGLPMRKDIDPNASYYRETPFDFIKTFKEAATGPGIKVSELSVSSDGKTKTITEGFGESAIKSIASNFVKLVDIDEDKKNYYTIRAKDPQIYPAQKLADYDKKVKQYFPDITVDDEDPLSIALAEAIIEAEGRKSQKFENAPRISVSTGDSAAKGEFIDYYKQLSDLADKPFTFNTKPGGPKMLGVPMRKITSTSLQKLIIDIANDLNPKKNYNQTNLYVKKLDDGTIRIIDANNNIDLGQINEADINIPTQAASPEKRAAARAAKVIKPAAAPAFVFPNNIKTF
jgi:hypothetical protein